LDGTLHILRDLAGKVGLDVGRGLPDHVLEARDGGLERPKQPLLSALIDASGQLLGLTQHTKIGGCGTLKLFARIDGLIARGIELLLYQVADG
jgi:hypothetical protein